MDKTENILKELLNFLNAKKTKYIKLLDIRNITEIADYFIILSMDNMRAVNSIKDELIDLIEEHNITVRNIEGNNSNWILIDLNDIIIHIFNEEDRKFYDLEKIWADAKEITI